MGESVMNNILVDDPYEEINLTEQMQQAFSSMLILCPESFNKEDIEEMNIKIKESKDHENNKRNKDR